jgi:hypothetical protein
VVGVAIENAAHFYDRTTKPYFFTKDLRAIWRGKNSFADVKANLAPINVKSGNHLYIIRPIRTNLLVHQPDASAVDRGAVIKVYSLDERAGAVSDADNGDSYFSHF